MTLPPWFNPQLEVLVAIMAALIFVAAFLTIFLSAMVVFVAARLLYLATGWLVRNAGRSSLLGRMPGIRTEGLIERPAPHY